MELNLALNTIIYIMIFLFPGILFRKFLYIQKDSPQFDSGNLFERFLLTLFYSLISLSFTGAVFFIVKFVLKIDLLDSLSYEAIARILSQLNKNELPPKNEIILIYKDLIILLASIYCMSSFLGFITYIINTKFFNSKLIFKSKNYWYNLFLNNNEYNPSDTLTYVFTQADVLIETNNGNKLYSGIIKDYFIDQTFNLKTLVLVDTNRYKNKEDQIEVKKIPGHHFVIGNERILNINLTYFYEDKTNHRKFKLATNILTTIYLLVYLMLIISMFLEYNPLSTFRKIIVFILGVFLLLSTYSIFINLLTKQLSKIKFEALYLVVILLLMLASAVGYLNFWIMILIQIILPFILSIFWTPEGDKGT